MVHVRSKPLSLLRVESALLLGVSHSLRNLRMLRPCHAPFVETGHNQIRGNSPANLILNVLMRQMAPRGSGWSEIAISAMQRTMTTSPSRLPRTRGLIRPDADPLSIASFYLTFTHGVSLWELGPEFVSREQLTQTLKEVLFSMLFD
jgi:hypothetical protein